MILKLLTLGTTVLTFLTPSASWQLPLDAPVRLARHFQQPSSDYSAGHRGVDYAVAQEQTVFAAASGQVIYSGRLANRSLISIRHSAGLASELEPVCSDFKAGEQVSKGQPIGYVCNPESGYLNHCQTMLCLHFSVRKNGHYISPLALIGGLSPSRLLPYARG